MEIKFLGWDSRFFGLKVGQAETEQVSVLEYENLLSVKKQSGYDIIYWFADRLEEPAGDLSGGGIPAPIDIKITYSKTAIIREPAREPNIELYKGPLTDKLIDLAIESGHKSRFRKDPRLSGRFVDMYTTWISRSVSGELSDAVFISKAPNDINGFVTIRKTGPVCVIGLIAVDQETRGQGIGGALINAAGNWCAVKGGQELKVATQFDNPGACRLYEKLGFARSSTKYILHI